MWNSLVPLLPTGMNFVVGAIFIGVIGIIVLVLTLLRLVLAHNGFPFFRNTIRGSVAVLALLIVGVPLVVVVVGEIGRQVAPFAKAALMYFEK
jgi:hypothetical protein